MEQSIQVMIWMIGGMATLMLFVWARLEKRFEIIDQRFQQVEQRFNQMENIFHVKFTLLQETVTDMDRRLCRLEGAFASKDCCMIKDSRHKEDSA